jgi:hypothetical protein
MLASSHRVRSFQQIVAKETVAGLDHAGVFSFKITLCPHKTGVLGNGGLRLKTVDVANLGDDAGRVYLAGVLGNGGLRLKTVDVEAAIQTSRRMQP